jgi:putrescine transport system ATP-binding protein
MAALVSFEHVSKRFGDFTALDGVTLDIFPQEFFALLGPSGCGKTTLLRLLAGFEKPDAGRVVLDGEDLAGVPPYRRPVNMMFQSYALFPHMTVAANVAFGLKQDALPKDEVAARVEAMLALVQMTAFASRKPDQLSGGQRQRVALARSLAKRPKVLLLDEPLAALDRKLREETRFELKALQKKLGTTFVIVTHDQDEAMTVADRIAVMDRARLVQVGAPADVYQRPATRWVAGFVGDVNFINVPDGKGVLALRPEKIRIARVQTEKAVSGVVTEIGYVGPTSVYKIRLSDGTMLKAAVMNADRVEPIQINNRVWVAWPSDAAVLLTE